jgi:hypothetical protein
MVGCASAVGRSASSKSGAEQQDAGRVSSKSERRPATCTNNYGAHDGEQAGVLVRVRRAASVEI